MARFNNVVDRKKYLHRGSWRKPDEDIDHVFYFYYVNPLTLTVGSTFGKQTVRPTAVIGVWGQHPFVKGDTLTLDNGLQLQVETIQLDYFDRNIVSRDHLIPRVQEMVVTLI